MVSSPLTKPYDGFSQVGWVICSTHVSILLVSCCCFQAAGAPVSVQHYTPGCCQKVTCLCVARWDSDL